MILKFVKILQPDNRICNLFDNFYNSYLRKSVDFVEIRRFETRNAPETVNTSCDPMHLLSRLLLPFHSPVGADGLHPLLKPKLRGRPPCR